MLVEHTEHELLSHPTSLQELPAPLDAQRGMARQEEGKKSTGETRLDKIIAGVQLIFCFHLINFSALPLTLQICLLNQLEANLTAGRMLPVRCFCSAQLRLCSTMLPREGKRKQQREKWDSPESLHVSRCLRSPSACFGAFFTFYCSEFLLPHNPTSRLRWKRPGGQGWHFHNTHPTELPTSASKVLQPHDKCHRAI